MRSAALFLLLLAIALPARAELVEWELRGTISSIGMINAVGGPTVPDPILAENGIVVGASLAATFILDTETPGEEILLGPGERSAAEYIGAVRAAEILVGDLVLAGGPKLAAASLELVNGPFSFSDSVFSIHLEEPVHSLSMDERLRVQSFDIIRPVDRPIDLEFPAEPPLPASGAVSGEDISTLWLGTYLVVIETDSLIRIRSTPPADVGEPILGYFLSRRNRVLNFWVDTKGCTRQEDFHIDVGQGTPVELTLVRDEPDPCWSFKRRRPKWIRFTASELGLEPGQAFVVRNRLGEQTPYQRKTRRRPLR